MYNARTVRALLQGIIEKDKALHDRITRKFPKTVRIMDMVFGTFLDIVSNPLFAIILTLVLVPLVTSETISLINALSMGSAWVIAVAWLARSSPLKDFPVPSRFMMVMSLAAIFAICGMSLGRWSTKQWEAHHKGGESKTPQEIPAQPAAANNLIFKLDGVFQMGGIAGFLRVPPGLPPELFVPKAVPPIGKDTTLVIVGTIANPRDIQATAFDWVTEVHLLNERVFQLEPKTPSNDIFINIPTGSKTLRVQDYWPLKLDMRTIPAHGVSYGFLFGILHDITPAEFDKLATTVKVCFKDTDGNQCCYTYYTRK